MKTSRTLLKRALLIPLICLMSMAKTMAQSFTVDNLNYSVNDDGISVKVLGHEYGTWAYGTLNIPETVSYNSNSYAVTAIADSAFCRCYNLSGNLVIPNSVTTIGESAFRGCWGITGNLVIPNSVTSIGKCAFYYCGFTGNLTIPNSVTTIGESAFYLCGGFTGSLTLPNSLTSIADSTFVLCNFTGSLVIPNSVTEIGDYAFCQCDDLTELNIGNSVTSIGDWAFSGCWRLSGDLIIPNSVVSIGEGAFEGCEGFTGNLIIGNSVTTIDDWAFVYCRGLTSLTISNSVTTIGDWSFYGCEGFTGNLTISNSVTTIGEEAFEECSGFTGSLTIPNSVISIGGGAFGWCSGFTSLTIGNSVTSIGGGAFGGCSGLISIFIPSSVTTLGGNAFCNCTGIEQITVASGNPIYDSRNNCNAIIETSSNTLITGCKNTVVPNTVSTIGVYAFLGCGLTSVVLPASVTTLEGFAYGWCDDLTVVNIPNHVVSIGNGVFAGCNGIEQITVEEGNPVYDSRGNCNAIIETSSNTLIQGCGSSVIPNSVVKIGDYSFHGCLGLTSIDMPDSVLEIGNWAFCGSGLSGKLKIGNSVTKIGNSSFQFCENLTSIEIGNSVTRIGKQAFMDCYNLSGDLVIPNSVIVIDDWAFGYDQSFDGTLILGNSLDSIKHRAFSDCRFNTIASLNEEPPTLVGDPFNYGSFDIPVYVPSGTIETYQNAYGWNEFTNYHDCEPVGDFTYMTPTNNYPFTSLPVTFTWDAVANAQHYDLYLWNDNDPMPEEPFVAGLSNGYYRCTSLPNHQTYQWYVKAYNPCNAIDSDIRTFTLDVEPELNVNMQSINFGEVALNQGTSSTLQVSGIVLEDNLNIEITGEDAAMFSFAESTNWDSLTGGNLIVTFTPSVAQYDYHANLIVSSGLLSQTVALTGSLANYYVFHTYVDEEVYPMNNIIPIHGDLKDANGNAVSNAEVEIGIFVMGMKRTFQATTNENGEFAVDFEPMHSESGYYTVNSGHVGNNSTAVHDDFNIPGMAVVTSDYILCAVTQDQPKTDTIRLRNKSNLPLNNIQVSIISAPEGCSFSFSPMSLGGLEEGHLIYTVTGTTLTQGNYYEEVKLKATSSEDAETVFTVWYYCMEPRGILNVTPNNITTTMTKGKSKIVDVMLSNNGTAATGNIFIDLPNVEWMSVVGSDTLSSLAVNDTAYFSLRFSPGEDIPLVQYTGSIAINCEHGEYANLPFAITAVSDSTGTIVVDITDDYTWNTNNGNGPHLEGAKVTLKGYYSLETVAQGFTDANGIFQVDNLPEGYYRLHVEADHHAQYDNNILVTAGETNNRSIYLQYQAVTYSWTVEPTEIPDEYTYELNVVFETNVPAPVVTIDISSQVPELEVGEAYTFNAIITNHGLIAARDFQLIVPELSEYMFYPLYDFIDSLPAQTTVVIPIMVNRVQSGRHLYPSRDDERCWARLGAMMYYVCGRDYEHNSDRYVWHHAYSREVFINTCVLNALANQLPDLPCFGCGGGSGNGSGGGIIEDYPPESHYEVGCHPCDNLLKDVVWSLPILSDFNYATGFIGGNGHSAYDHIVYWGGKLPYVGWVVQAGYFAGNLAAYLHCKWEYEFGSKNQWLNLDDFDYVFRLNDDIIEIYHEFYQDSLLYEKQGFELLNSLMMPYYSDIVEISESDAETIKSNLSNLDIPVATIEEIINRWNQTVVAWNDNVFEPNTNYPNIINKVHLESIGNDIIELCDYVISLGYDSFYAMIEDLYDILDEEVNKMSNSVCSTVTVQFSQKMTMTREAFEGTFNVHNGHDVNAMEGIGLNFTVKDENGNDCTDLFQINTTALTNLTAIDGTGSLGAGMDGMAKILFIPTKQAAPVEPKVYYFGGTFSFIDPYTSEELVYDLYPVDLTVHPSPDLYVDYFMQRDILGDDALTLDKVEPSIPAELGVIINNKGAGVAKNVILETAEPKIIDNEKGLAIDFAMYGASFNGNEAQLGLMEIPFGNIESGHTAVGEWLFTSSLLGHFVSYEAHVIHNNSYGNPNLSLVSHLDIHELIHPIRAYGDLDDGINDFLVNDVADYYDYPDSIYFSHGGKTSVSLFDNISFNHYVQPNDTIVTLTVNPSSVGWNYGLTDDPGTDKYELVSCTRDIDNQIIPLNNIWQTFVTLRDASDPIYENKLHIVDTLSSEGQDITYTLVYERKRDLLAVEEINGIPQSFIEYPLESFSVKFNKPIADSTFTYEDMTLKCNNGSNLMNSSVVISKVEDDLYNVNISSLTHETGYYVLNIHTLNINDAQGYNGYDGKQATWIQVLDGDKFIHISEDQAICENDSFDPLTSLVIGDAISFQWNRDGMPIAGANISECQPTEAGVYTLTVTFEDGDVLTSNEVTLVAYPSYQITIEDEICEGDDYTMYGFNLINPAFGTYNETLYVQTEYGCDSIVILNLLVHENPVVQIHIDTLANGNQGFMLYATGADSYEWSTGETTAYIMVSPSEPTTYSVIGTNNSGCSDVDTITVSIGTGIEENMTLSTDLYPNPAHDKLFVKASEPIMLVEIYTTTGTLVYKHANNCNEMEISVNDFAAGVYVIRIVSETSTETKRFIVE